MSKQKVCGAVLCTVLTASLFWILEPVRGQVADAGMKIVVLEGEDGVNIIKKKTAVKPIVEVRDKNDLPIAGVALVISLDAAGVFDSGGKQATLTTDASGRATVPHFSPTTKGAVEIHVAANSQGQSASITIHQTNFSTVAQALKAGKTPGSSSGSASSSSASASSGSSSGSSAAAAGSSAVASSGGLSGLAVAGMVAGGAAAAGVGAAYATGVLGGNSGPNCSSQLNNVESAVTSLQNACGVNASTAQCQSAAQNVLNTLGQACGCFGSSIPSQDASIFQQLISELQQDGFSTTQYASCGK